MKQGMDRGRGNAKKRVADMSLPAEQRRRKRKGKGRGTKGVVAQMDHGNNPEAAEARSRRCWRSVRAPAHGRAPPCPAARTCLHKGRAPAREPREPAGGR
jgi:hypothetical protein